jgi:hypothetical protein
MIQKYVKAHPQKILNMVGTLNSEAHIYKVQSENHLSISKEKATKEI